MKKNSLRGIELSRTIGIEVEGYTKNFPKLREGVRHAQVKRDASLANSYGYGYQGVGTTVGMEVVSNPLSKLDMLDEMFADIQATKWNVGRGRAGTHIHVDARDFTAYDKIKMAIFMHKLEEVMFMMVKPYRYSRSRYGGRNRYCNSIDSKWLTFLELCKSNRLNPKNFDHVNDLIFRVSQSERSRGNYPSMPHSTRYNFVNIFNTGRVTIEFRLFHAIRDAKDAKKFALLAYHIIETVKNSTIEQLDFIAEGVNKCNTAQGMVNLFTQAIGLDMQFKIYNNDLKDRIERRKAQVVAV